jgi:hypothetical protein
VLVPGIEEEHGLLQDLLVELHQESGSLPLSHLGEGDHEGVRDVPEGLEEIPQEVQELRLGEERARVRQGLEGPAFEMWDRKGGHRETFLGEGGASTR